MNDQDLRCAMIHRSGRIPGIAMLLLLIGGCGEVDTLPEPVRPVRAAKVGSKHAMPGRQFPGRAAAKQDVEMSFQVSGLLMDLPVDVGTEVKQGDIIGALEPQDFQAALAMAEGNLARERSNLLAMERGARPEEIQKLRAALAEAEALHRESISAHERNIRLIKEQAASQEDFDRSLARQERNAAQVASVKEELNIGLKGARPEDLDAKRAEIRALEAAVASAQNQLNYATLKAPFSGRVAARYVDNYQTVQAKQPVVRLVDLSKIEITVQVPESLITLVPQLRKVVCRFDAFTGKEFDCEVTKIGSEASQVTRTYPVTVQLDQPDDLSILPGMAATVQGLIDVDQVDDGLIVPAGAVFAAEGNDQSSVWIVDESSQTVSRQEVEVLRLMADGLTVVADGIKEGSWVVTAGVHSLREGQQVKLLQAGS